MNRQMVTLSKVLPLLEYAPPKVIATTAWARSRAKLCAGAQRNSQKIRKTASTSAMVARVGVPPAP